MPFISDHAPLAVKETEMKAPQPHDRHRCYKPGLLARDRAIGSPLSSRRACVLYQFIVAVRQGDSRPT